MQLSVSAGTQDTALLHYAVFYGIDEPVYDGAVIPTRTNVTAPSPNLGVETTMSKLTDGSSNTFMLGETDFMPKGVPSTEYGGDWAFGYIGYAWGTHQTGRFAESDECSRIEFEFLKCL